jgi:hypothetical protein
VGADFKRVQNDCSKGRKGVRSTDVELFAFSPFRKRQGRNEEASRSSSASRVFGSLTIARTFHQSEMF